VLVDVNDNRPFSTLNCAGGDVTVSETATLCVLPEHDADVQVSVTVAWSLPAASDSAALVRPMLTAPGVVPPLLIPSHGDAGLTVTE
jgi:hypothetical protein